MTEHEITVEANCRCDRIDAPWLEVTCSCEVVLIPHCEEPVPVWDIVGIAQKHVDAEVVGTSSGTFVLTPEYVHGLDPDDEDPRRVMPR